MRVHKCTRCGHERATKYDESVGQKFLKTDGAHLDYTATVARDDELRYLGSIGWGTMLADPSSLLCPSCMAFTQPATLEYRRTLAAIPALAVADQPPPVRTDRRPCWDIVISYVRQCKSNENAYGKTGIVDLVLADMRERDQTGRQRYGVPLTSRNGRNHLVDAYQELLDYVVYLTAELDEHEAMPFFMDRDQLTFKYRVLNQMVDDALLHVFRLRAFIEEAKGQR